MLLNLKALTYGAYQPVNKSLVCVLFTVSNSGMLSFLSTVMHLTIYSLYSSLTVNRATSGVNLGLQVKPPLQSPLSPFPSSPALGGALAFAQSCPPHCYALAYNSDQTLT